MSENNFLKIEQKEELNEIKKWLDKLKLKNIDGVCAVFDECGVDDFDDLKDLGSDDINEITLKIRVIPDRIKIRKELDKWSLNNNNNNNNNNNGSSNDKRVRIRRDEEEALNKLDIYINTIESRLNGITDIESKLQDVGQRCKDGVNKGFNDLMSKLVERKNELICNIDEMQKKHLNDLRNKASKCLNNLDECIKQKSVLTKLVDTPIESKHLNKRANKVVDTVTKYCNPNEGIFKTGNIYYELNALDDLSVLLSNFGSVGDSKCPLYFNLSYEALDSEISLIYKAIDDEKIGKNDLIRIVYKQKDNKKDHLLEFKLNGKECGTIGIKIPPQRNKSNTHDIWEFKIAYLNENGWTMFSDPKSIDIKEQVKWETNMTWKSPNIYVYNDNQISTNIQDREFPSAYLSDVIKHGKHVYTFRILKTEYNPVWGILFGLYKIGTGIPKPDVDLYFDGLQKNYGYVFTSKGYIRTRSRDKEYGFALHAQDIVRMIVDLKNKMLSFKINNIQYPKAFDVDAASYKVGITLENKNYAVQFVQHKIEGL